MPADHPDLLLLSGASMVRLWAECGDEETTAPSMNSLVKGLNHITFSVSDLDVSLAFYQQVFDATLLLRAEGMAYLDLSGLWLALNVQEDISRREIRQSYTHLAFTVNAEDMEQMEDRLRQLHVPIRPGRPRSAGEAHSLYFTDPDGYLLEVHSGDLAARLAAYKEALTSSRG